MKKLYLKLMALAMVTAGVTANAQEQTISSVREKSTAPKIHKCFTVEAMEAIRSKNPAAETDAQFEAWMQQQIQMRKASKTALVNYTVPVIFHVISKGTAVTNVANSTNGYNISQAVIQQQILELNKAYSNNTNSPYAVAANTGIQFALAQKNTSGTVLAEPGIERINLTSKGWSDPTTTPWTQTYIDATVKSATIWNPSNYLNVWVVPAMTNGTDEILGYATFPTSSGLTGITSTETVATAGLVVEALTLGSVYAPQGCGDDFVFSQGGTLVHELGHFFGLRHIWGDSNCGTDYCDDTPVHFTANSGVPTHPKPNSCGTPDEMFENYMDYTDDAILNTFTQNQADRMQTVMSVSPRRASLALATNPAGLVPVTASNKAAFSECTGILNVTEAALSGTYPRYRDVSLNLNIEDKATAAATVTINTAGTASAGTYQVLTPTLTFAAGDSYKPVKIRLFDNAVADGDRSIVVSYSISGTGVTAGTTAQTVTINVLDDEKIPIGDNSVMILGQNFDSTITGWSTLASSGAVNRFTVSPNANTAGGGGTGSSAHVTNNTTTRPYTYTQVTTAGLAVLQSPLINPIGLPNATITFKYGVRAQTTSTDYGWLGYSPSNNNLSVLIFNAAHYAGNTTTVTGNPSFTLASLGLDNTQFYFDFGFSWDATGGNNPPMNFDDIMLTCDGIKIETAMSNSYGFDVPTGANSSYFRSSANNKIIASLSNSSVALPQISAAVTQSGTGRPNITTTAGTYLRTEKVITLSQATVNNSATYTATFYYNTSEMAAWGAAVPNLKVIQVNAGTDIFGSLNPGNTVILTPTITDKRTTDGYVAFTVTTSGFGQFAVVEQATILPLTWLSFTGKLVENNKVNLVWKTGAETNNKGFEVQRSSDAVEYKKIGWVDGLNGSVNNYTFTDANIVKGNKYYYRLKQTDNDNRYSYSSIVVISYLGGKELTLYPNPVHDKLVILNGSNTNEKATIVITDAAGKVVYNETQTLTNKVEIPSAMWSNGIYLVKITTTAGTDTYKIMKQ